jgi:hypothetical protein
MTYRELLKELKKKAKKKGLLDAKIEETVLRNPWDYTTYVDLIDPEDGSKRHIKFGYREGKRDHNGNNLEETEAIFKDWR